MSYGQRGHLRKLLRTYQQRLQLLEQRAAREGFHTPPEVTLEIQDLQNKIRRIEKTLNPAIFNRPLNRNTPYKPTPAIDSSEWQRTTNAQYYSDHVPTTYEVNSSESEIGGILFVIVIGIVILFIILSSTSHTSPTTCLLYTSRCV